MSNDAQGQIPVGDGMTASELFDWAVTAADPERPFVYFKGETYSYQAIYDRSLEVAATLAKLGVRRGDHVLTVVANTPRTLGFFFGVARIGAVYVPLNPQSVADEVRFFIEDCAPRIVVLDEAGWESTSELLAELPVADVLLLDEGCTSKESLGAGTRISVLGPAELDEGQIETPRLDDVLCVLYTSGTTARPKGVILNQESFGVCAEIHAKKFHAQFGEVFLGVMPLFHCGGLYQCVGPALAVGGGLMLQERFSVSRFWGDVDFSGATVGLMMPAMPAMLLARADGPRESTLRVVLTHFVDKRFEEWFGTETILIWAMSEIAALGVLTEPGYPDRDLPHLVGWPVDDRVEIRIADDDGEALPIGKVGEITARHPWVLQGYLNRPEETAATLRDGWVFSGDLGMLDEQGRLFYRGRKKNMIKRSGENVAGLEVEEAIREHPGVETCACFAVPDPVRTEEVKAAVLLVPGATVGEEEIVEWCSERLVAFKVPRYVEIRDSLPYTSTQKVDLAKLKAEHEGSPGWDREQHPVENDRAVS
jgi:crotonobetaine/carnitine-CoA ligase